MRRTFTASLTRDGDWCMAQCLEVDVASPGESPDEASANLREALELHFDAPVATELPELKTLEVEISAA